MKVVHIDRATGTAKLRVDALDDLWHLHELITPGDVVTALTWRTADVDRKEDDRAGKAEKRAMTLTVKVESVEWDAFSNRLRVLGPIIAGQQDIGNYHTIVVEPPIDITLQKLGGLKPHHIERIQQAVAAAQQPQVVFLAIEENESVVALLRQYGVQKMVDIAGHVSGKQYARAKGEEESFFEEILMALRDYRPENAPLLVLGPGFAKERFMAYARQKQPALVKGAAIEATGQAGLTGVHEAIKRGSVERVAKNSRVGSETALVEKLFEAIAKSEPSAYGASDVEKCIGLGAVDVVLVSDQLVREGPGERFLDLARETGAQAHIISSHHEAGARFLRFAGIGALLRYRVE